MSIWVRIKKPMPSILTIPRHIRHTGTQRNEAHTLHTKESHPEEWSAPFVVFEKNANLFLYAKRPLCIFSYVTEHPHVEPATPPASSLPRQEMMTGHCVERCWFLGLQSVARCAAKVMIQSWAGGLSIVVNTYFWSH